MKRLLALLLSAVMLTGMPLPALAEGEAADAQLTQVTQMVKETLDLDTSGYDNFQGERWQQELATVWQLNWSGPEASLSVEALEDGTIVSYSLTGQEDGAAVWSDGALPTFPQGDPEAAAAAAESFLGRVLDAGLESVRLEEPQGDRLGTDSYRFSGTILLHGIPSPLSYHVTVRASDSQVIRFTRDAVATSCLGSVPGPETSVDTAQAEEALWGTLSMRLEYVLPEEDSGSAVLRYLPEPVHDYYVDAKTGELVDLTALEEEMMRGAGGGDAAAPESAPSGGTLSNSGALTQAEQEGIQRLEGVQSSANLDAALRGVPEYGLDTYSLTSALYQLLEADGEDQVLCRLAYHRAEGETIFRRTFTVDARTGEVQSVWSSAPWEEGRVPALTLEEAQAVAEAFLAAYYPDHSDHLALYDTIDDTGEGAPSYTFTFARQENGIFFPEDFYRLGIDAADGSVSGLDFQFHEGVTFQSPEGIVDADTALGAWAKTRDVSLGYLLVPRPLQEKVPAEARLMQMGLTHFYGLELGYTLELREGSWIGVDAKTGEALQGEDPAEDGPAYGDLEGHWAQEEVEKLARYGVGYASSSFQPDRALTQADLVCLLASTRNQLLLDPEAATEEELDEAYAAVYRLGALARQARDDRAVLTRSEVVQILLNAAGYGKVARLEGIFICSFTDQTEIPREELGYAALAEALGLARGTYAGGRTATRAEAAVMLCRLLED